ncbi:MAG: hypothetical protein KAR79_03745 [Simkaniaceae bacterium]|nr:hypothetical protein [Simkaniaceae bacterium]
MDIDDKQPAPDQDEEISIDKLGSSITTQTLKYWEDFLAWLFKYPSLCYYLLAPSNIQTIKNSYTNLQDFSKNFMRYSSEKGLICKVTSDPKDLEITNRLLIDVFENVKNPLVCELITAEIIAKILAYRNLHKDDQVYIPTLNELGQTELKKYTVDKVFDLWNKVSAFGLRGESSAPILIFRGTDLSLTTEGGRASMISDFDPIGPGKTLFDHAESNILEWLQEMCQNTKKARLVGHSLGGAFVTYALLSTSKYISNKAHEISYAFNYPGVSLELSSKWDLIPEESRPNFKGFISRGDVISKLGFLFGDIYELSINNRLSPILAHELLHFAQPSCYIQEVDVVKENLSSSRKNYSTIQKHTSSMIYHIGLKYLFPHQ